MELILKYFLSEFPFVSKIGVKGIWNNILWSIRFKILEKTLKCNMPWMHDEFFFFFNLEKSGSLHGHAPRADPVILLPVHHAEVVWRVEDTRRRRLSHACSLQAAAWSSTCRWPWPWETPRHGRTSRSHPTAIRHQTRDIAARVCHHHREGVVWHNSRTTDEDGSSHDREGLWDV
jgi:hypothetical protein